MLEITAEGEGFVRNILRNGTIFSFGCFYRSHRHPARSRGAAEVILDLVKALAADGMRVALIVGRTDKPQTDLDGFCREFGIELYRAPRLLREVSPVDDFLAFLAIRRIIGAIHPAIVHTHTSKAGIIGRFAAWSAGIKHIVHSPRGHIFYGYYGRATTLFFVMLERLAAGMTEAITTLTEKGKRDHIEKGIGPEKKFAVVHSGVDVKLFAQGDGSRIRHETGFADALVVGWAGRLDPEKNCLLFIEAASMVHTRLPYVRFVVAGDGEEHAVVRERAGTLGLADFIRFLGNRNDMPDVMAAFDVFVLSSRNEGFGRVLVEAMAAGAVPVATRVGGTVDVIEDTVSGLLVQPGDPGALADAVCLLLEDEELRSRLRENGRKQAERFTIHAMVQKFEDLYAKLLHS